MSTIPNSSTGIRNITLHRGTSVSHTVSLAIQSNADTGHTSFTDPQVYSNQPAKRRAAFADTALYAARAGLDTAGATSVNLAGGYHSGGNGSDTYERLTAIIKDQDGNRMYFYRKSDRTFWDRVHIPKNTDANAHIWDKIGDYVPITQQQFQSKQAPLKLAVCLFPDLTVLDFMGPVTVLKILESRNIQAHATSYPTLPPVQIETTYFSHNRAPIIGDVGPDLIPQRTYGEVLENFEQFDLILVPGGVHAAPDAVDPSLMEFLNKQAPDAKYILTVCSGSWILAGTGLLDGKKATTNKRLFKTIVAATDKSIEWVPKARWVVDGNIWTSSGVTAGMDMANAFVEFLADKEFATLIRTRIELGVRNQEDDEFAEIHGLV